MPIQKQHIVPTSDLKEKLKNIVNSQLETFTILSNSYLTEFETLKKTIEAFPKEFVRNLVSLRPERLIEHEILAQLQANIKLDKLVSDEADTFGMAFTLVQRAMKDHKIQAECTEVYSRTSKELSRVLDCLIDGKEVTTQQLSSEDVKTVQTFYNELSQKEPWSKDKDLLKLVCMQRGMAIIYTQEARKIIEPVVQQEIEALCKAGTLEKLNPVGKQEGVAVFTTGGVASGKGSCLSNIEESLGKRTPTPIHWNEMVHHNADRLKPFLLKPEIDPLKYSQYTYEEALLVKERIMTILEQQGKTSGNHPHFLHDQTKLKADELKQANERYGEIIIAAVSTDAASAIERAFYRGQSTNRYEHTEGLLGSHQAVPGELIKSLCHDELIGNNNITVVMYDNNSPTRQLGMFASIDMHNKSIVIYDEEQMQSWIKKELINPKAQTEEELYNTTKPVRSNEEYFGPLMSKGFTLTYELKNTESLTF